MHVACFNMNSKILKHHYKVGAAQNFLKRQ